jgi:hypothetical protein
VARAVGHCSNCTSNLKMRTLDRQMLDAVNQPRSNLFGWRGQCTPEFKPIEFEGFGNCGEFATIRGHAAILLGGFNPVEFDGIRSLGNRWFA